MSGFRNSRDGYLRFEGGKPEVAATAEALLALRGDQDTLGRSSTRIERSIQWLLEHRDSQGESNEATPTPDAAGRAWTLWALAEFGQADLDSELEQVAARALEMQDAQQSALAALAANRLENDELLGNLLDALTQQQAEDGHVGGKSISDIEMTALAALAWLTQPSYVEPAADAATWLLSARDDSGGFGSARGTALALQALVKHAESTRRVVRDGRIVVRLDGELLSERAVTGDRRQAIVLDDFSSKLKTGRNSLRVLLTDGNELPYTLAFRYYRREQPAHSGTPPVELRTELEKPKIDEGQTVRLSVRLQNTSEQTVALPVADIGLPAGLEIAPSLLDAQKKAGRITAYETRPRRLILYWRTLEPGDQVELAFDATATLPGHFSGPPSFAYLLQDEGTKYWSEPLTVVIGIKK